MKFNPNGFVANTVFSREGKRKNMGVCTLLPLFVLKLAVNIFSSLIHFFILLVGTPVAALSGYRPNSPSKVRMWDESTLFVPYVSSDKAGRLKKFWVTTMCIFCALYIVTLLSGFLGVIAGHFVDFRFIPKFSFDSKDGFFQDVLAGLLTGLAGWIVFLVARSLLRVGKSETVQLIMAWAKSKKDRACPIVVFE